MELSLKTIINRQINHLSRLLQDEMRPLAVQCALNWGDSARITELLASAIQRLAGCRLVYIIDENGIQISPNISHAEIVEDARGEDLSRRPYFMVAKPDDVFLISPVYLCRVSGTSMITVMHRIFDGQSALGYIAADFRLKELPYLHLSDEKPAEWRQIKGDPAIRSGLFRQHRVTNSLDENLDSVNAIITELMSERGIFHAKVYYSSARATLWHYKDPYHYQLHVLREIIDPSVCLVYPASEYPPEALVNAREISQIWSRFADLRNADSTIYLRSASLNVISGMIGLNFSCDGSHFMSASEFLSKKDDFWFGTCVA